MNAAEVNFDGVVGPTHHYAGLSFGNVASLGHAGQPSNPKRAALEGLAKMKFLSDLGVRQGVLPPHDRPDIAALRRLGFTGNDAQALDAARSEPAILASCASASAMWAANAATVSPSADTLDGRVHFTAANLCSQFHRSLEASTTSAVLKAIFADESRFAHHCPLPAGSHFADEGAANHMRLCAAYGQKGLEIFTYGRSSFTANESGPSRFPARQTREASAAVARLHALDTGDVFFVRQNPQAIDAGAFHNDVVAVSNLNVLLYHVAAFVDSDALLDGVRQWFDRAGLGPPHLIEVSDSQVPLRDAVSSYLFNSQLVQLPDETIALIAPTESRNCATAHCWLNELLNSGGPIRHLHFVDVRQSMHNGGGPACLRLRVVLTERELAAANQAVFLSDVLHDRLKDWIERHYRDHLVLGDLADPRLLDEGRAALDELTRILNLGNIYGFQRG